MTGKEEIMKMQWRLINLETGELVAGCEPFDLNDIAIEFAMRELSRETKGTVTDIPVGLLNDEEE